MLSREHPYNSSLEWRAHFHRDEHDRLEEERQPESNGKHLSAWLTLKANCRDLGFGSSILAGAFTVSFLTVLKLSLTVGHNSIIKHPMASLGILASGDCPGFYRTLLLNSGILSGYMEFLLKSP